MKRIPRPSPAMLVAIAALVVAVGGSATALPGKRTVARDDLRNGSVGARALGRALLEHRDVVRSVDPVAGDGVFTETEGTIRCPPRAPFAFDPSVGPMGPDAFEQRRMTLPNRFGGPGGYRIVVLGDQGPDVGYTMTVNCLPTR